MPLTAADPPGAPHMQPPAFELADVTLRRAGRDILLDVNATIPVGRATAVVGPSGSGKSTLLRLLNRFDDPDRGVVRRGGVDVRSLDVLELRRGVGLVSQRPVLLSDTLAAEVRVGAGELSDAAVSELLARVGLGSFAPDRSTTGLSGGEIQRLALARALALDPDVLLLDEPTSALDSDAADAVDDVVRSLVVAGLTAVVVSHDLSRLADIAGHVIVLAAGRIVEHGPPDSVGYLGGRGHGIDEPEG